MIPPLAMDGLDRRMVGGNGVGEERAAERMRRLHEFRQRHKGMGMLYRLLDVPYGIELATDDVARFTRAQAVWWALAFDACLTLFFGLLWLRYDLLSTWNAMDPIANSLSNAALPILAWLQLPPEVAAFLGAALAILVRVIAALLPSLIQFRMPYDASRHDAMWLALWISVVFDLGTDSVDIRTDISAWFGWLISAAQNADRTVWLSLIGLGVLLFLIRGRQWPLWAGLIAVAVACLGWGQAGNVVYWANVALWTAFASFAAQSIAFIYLAKVLMLLAKGRALAAVEGM
ncbi:MAG: hypothetical protein WCJ55_14855 [Chloroflexales bacterium]